MRFAPITFFETTLYVGLMVLGGWILFSAIQSAPTVATLEERNAQREQDVRLIMQALQQYRLEHDGQLPDGIVDEPQELCGTVDTCDGLLDLIDAVSPYLDPIPVDPHSASDGGTDYVIARNGTSVVVTAINAEGKIIETQQ